MSVLKEIAFLSLEGKLQHIYKDLPCSKALDHYIYCIFKVIACIYSSKVAFGKSRQRPQIN